MPTEAKEENGAFSVPLLAKSEDCEEVQPSTKDTTAMAQTEKDLVCLNVGGKKFFVMLHNFNKFPNTRLGQLMLAETKPKILELCDKYIDDTIPEYFFDRSWKGFNDILDVYRLGRLHLNSAGFCAIRTQALMKYWQIDELLLDPCCALKYYPEIETAAQEIEGQIESERKYNERILAEDFGNTSVGKIRSFLWNLTEYPETSMAAQITAFTSMSVVIVSTITFILSTMPELTDDIDIILFENNSTAGEVIIFA